MTHPFSTPFTDKRVLITGGLGFIGSNLARRLAGAGARVTVVDSLIPEYGGNLFNIEDLAGRITVNISDVRDSHSMAYLVQGQDFLFNLAGQTSHMDSMSDPYTDLDINCSAQLYILEACRRHNPGVKLVFASTRQIYGKPDYLPVDEKHPLRPVDVNGINKLAGEEYHILYNNVYGVRGTVLRLTNTYGPRMRVRDARQTFLGVWVKCIVQGQPFEVWEGHQLRDFTYVDDAVDALMLAAIRPGTDGQVYNLGGGEVVSLQQLADLLARLDPKAVFQTRSYPADRKRIDIGDYYATSELFTSVTGWKQRVSLETGLGKTLDFYRKHIDRYL